MRDFFYDKNFFNFVFVVHKKYFFSLPLASEYVSFTHVYLQTCSECTYALGNVLGAWNIAVNTVDNKPRLEDVM